VAKNNLQFHTHSPQRPSNFDSSRFTALRRPRLPPPSNSVQLDAQEQVDKPTEHAGSKWQHSRRHARQLIGGLTFGIPACGRFKPSEKSAKGWRWLRSQRCGTQAKGQASSSLSLASRATWRWLVRLTDDGRQVAIAAAATRHLVGALSTSTKRRGNRLVSTAIRAKTEFATKTSLRPDGVPRAQGQAARCTHFLISSSTRRRTQARIHIPTVMISRSVRGGGDAARVPRRHQTVTRPATHANGACRQLRGEKGHASVLIFKND
jgi:hypothetical protein